MKRKINAYAVCFNPKNLHVVSSDFCFDICDICGKWYKSELDMDYHKKKHEASLNQLTFHGQRHTMFVTFVLKLFKRKECECSTRKYTIKTK